MKFLPKRNQILGRLVAEKSTSLIIRSDPTKSTTKLILVDAIGSGVQEIKVGDVLVSKMMSHFMLDGGAVFRPLTDEENVVLVATEVNIDDLHVQTDNGSEYVPFDSEKAAISFAAKAEGAV